jgi:hypothetical protein
MMGYKRLVAWPLRCARGEFASPTLGVLVAAVALCDFLVWQSGHGIVRHAPAGIDDNQEHPYEPPKVSAIERHRIRRVGTVEITGLRG